MAAIPMIQIISKIEMDRYDGEATIAATPKINIVLLFDWDGIIMSGIR